MDRKKIINKNEKRVKNLKKKKAEFQNLLYDVTKGKGKASVGGQIKILNTTKENSINTLHPDSVYQTNRRDVVPVSIDLIKLNPINREFFNSLSDEEWQDFKNDILERGVIQPLIAYKEPGQGSRWMLIDGEQRLKAAKELNLKTVPVQITNKPENKAIERTFLIKANLLRRQLSDKDKKKLYKALSKEERINLYLDRYGQEKILRETRGGDRKSNLIKKDAHLLKISPQILKKEIIEDTNLPEGTVNRDLAFLRKQLKSKEKINKEQLDISEVNFSIRLGLKLEKLVKEIALIDERIGNEEKIYHEKIKEIKIKKNEKLKKLKNQKKIKENELKQIRQ